MTNSVYKKGTENFLRSAAKVHAQHVQQTARRAATGRTTSL